MPQDSRSFGFQQKSAPPPPTRVVSRTASSACGQRLVLSERRVKRARVRHLLGGEEVRWLRDPPRAATAGARGGGGPGARPSPGLGPRRAVGFLVHVHGAAHGER